MTTLRNPGILLALVAAAGCAPAMPPQDLVTARVTYDRVAHGPTATLDPTDLHSANTSLALAERSFAENGDTQATRDLAYVADRSAQTAEARGDAMQFAQEQQQTLGKMHDTETSQLAATSGQLGRANAQLALQGQALSGEQLRRQDAEKRAEKAAADLSAFASVKQEPRGMVITLSGGVLFVSSRSDLLPAAQTKLDAVAQALTQQDGEAKIAVEGHTDSQGGAAYNQLLSQQRAKVVRDYLVGRGIAPDRVVWEGFGPSRPVADNGTAEGRADNRRVEIVVRPAAPRP